MLWLSHQKTFLRISTLDNAPIVVELSRSNVSSKGRIFNLQLFDSETQTLFFLDKQGIVANYIYRIPKVLPQIIIAWNLLRLLRSSNLASKFFSTILMRWILLGWRLPTPSIKTTYSSRSSLREAAHRRLFFFHHHFSLLLVPPLCL